MDPDIAGRNALITGAAGGMGRAIAKDLAAAGANLILTGLDADELEPVDILVHAAGVTGAKGDPLEMSDDDWREAWDIDLMSAVRLARLFVPAMKTAGWAGWCSSLRKTQRNPTSRRWCTTWQKLP